MPRIEQRNTHLSSESRSERIFQPPDDSLEPTDMYFQSIGKYPKFSVEEERKVFQEYTDGLTAVQTIVSSDDFRKNPTLYDSVLRTAIDSVKQIHDSIVLHNQGLVIFVAEKYYSSLSFLERIQNGNIGLLKAIEEFNPDRGTKFSTFATWKIRNAMINRSRAEVNEIQIPIRQVDKIHLLLKFQDSFAEQYGRLPTAEECCDEFGWRKTTFKNVIQAGSLNHKIACLDMPLSDEVNSNTFGDTIPDPKLDEVHSIENLLDEEDTNQMKLIYDTLHAISESSEKGSEDVSIFVAYFSHPELTIARLAKDFGCSTKDVKRSLKYVWNQFHELSGISNPHMAFLERKIRQNKKLNQKIPQQVLDEAAGSMRHGDRKVDIYKRHVFHNETLEEIGHRYGVKRQRIFQIVSDVEKVIQRIDRKT